MINTPLLLVLLLIVDSLHTIVLTLSPLVAVLWSLGLFGLIPGLQQMLGGGVVLGGVLVASLRNFRQNDP